MADRVVKVDAILGGDAKREMEALGYVVKTVDGEVDRLNRDLKKTADETLAAAATMKALDTSVGGVGNKFAGLGGNRTVLSDLDAAIIKSQTEVRRLGDEFNRTGSIDVFKDFSKNRSALDEFQKLRKELTAALNDGAQDSGKQGGGLFSSAFAQSIRNMLTTPVLGPMSILVVGGIVAALLPALDGALIALGSMGGLATGIIGQLQNPRVTAAFQDFGKSLMDALGADTKVFAEPIISALAVLKVDLRNALGSIDFSALAKQLEPLISAIGTMVTVMMPGFNKMLESSGPVMTALGQGLRSLGVALSDVFEMMSHSGPGAAEGLKLAFGLLIMAVIAVGAVLLSAAQALNALTIGIEYAGKYVGEFFDMLASAVPKSSLLFRVIADGLEGLSKAADLVGRIGHAFRDTTPNVSSYAGKIADFAASASKASDDLGELEKQLSSTAVTMDTVEAKAAQKLFTQIMNVDQGILGFNKSLLDMQDALNQNGKAIDKHTGLVDMHTKAGIADREAVLAVMTANMQQYQSFIAAGGGAAEATEKYNKNTAQLEDMLHKAHYTQAQIDDMIGSLKRVPGMTHADIVSEGLTSAINNLSNLIAMLNGLNGKAYGFSVTAAVYDPGASTRSRMLTGGIYEHAEFGKLRDAQVYSPASGGPARYAFAEPATGGEAFVPKVGDYGRSTSILDQASRWYGGRFMPGGWSGGGTTNVSLTLTLGAGGAPADRALAQIAHYAIRSGALTLTAGGTPVTVG